MGLGNSGCRGKAERAAVEQSKGRRCLEAVEGDRFDWELDSQ